jgi:hypothetical protein
MKQLMSLHPKYNSGETARDNKIKYSKQGNNLKIVTDVLMMYNFINVNSNVIFLNYVFALLSITNSHLYFCNLELLVILNMFERFLQ